MEREHQETLGHKRRLFTPCFPSTRTDIYFSLELEVDYVWTVLCFGCWVVSVRLVRMLGSRTVLEGPLCTVLVLIEDFHFTNLRSSRNGAPRQQADAAREGVHLELCVFYRMFHVRAEMRNKYISIMNLGGGSSRR